MDKDVYTKHTPEIKDYGPEALIININKLAKENKNYRSTLWTGKHMQITLMSIPIGGDIGIEMHKNVDQFIRVEEGFALITLGKSKSNLNCTLKVNNNYAAIIPANTWHNIINTGSRPLKLYSIYAPPNHNFGTMHKTKKIAEEEESEKN